MYGLFKVLNRNCDNIFVLVNRSSDCLVLYVWKHYSGAGRNLGGSGSGGDAVSSRSNTVYLNLSEITEVHDKDVFVKDVAKVYCSDTKIQNKCECVKLKHISEEKCRRYVENALDVIEKLEEVDPSVSVTNVGKVEYIIDYQPPAPPRHLWQWTKTFFVCIICFCGAAFAIMTFNNDANVRDVFQELYYLVTGKEASGMTILELTYSIGLALGILVFFNHFAKWKLTTDPTPLEVEMRLYEDNISKTLIQNDGRKEQGIDVQ
ncbi:stage V sporulation protein AA [Clostridiaceae bacterium]|nr:stage V sporulation protein AA [Clostridiaceae bacterium]